MKTLINLEEISSNYSISINTLRKLAKLGHFGNTYKDSHRYCFDSDKVNEYLTMITQPVIHHKGKEYFQHPTHKKVYLSKDCDYISTNYYVINEDLGFIDRDGYVTIGPIRLHRGMYETFVGPIPEGFEIDHIDGTKNNAIDNLRIVTPEENKKLQHKLRKANYKLSENDVIDIRNCYNSGESNASIYNRYKDKLKGIASIYNITSNRTWN